MRKIVLLLFFSFSCGFSSIPEWLYYLGSEGVLSILNHNEYLWIGTTGGLKQFNIQSKKIIHYNTANTEMKDNHVRAVTIDYKNNVFLGTNFGIARFDGTQWYSYTPLNTPMPFAVYKSLSVDTDNRIWGGTYGSSKLAIYDWKDWIFYDVIDPVMPQNSINSIIHNWNGKTVLGVSCAGKSWGLGYANQKEFILDSAIQSPVSCIAVDKDNNLWLGTEKQGLLVYDGKSVKVFDTSNSDIPSNQIFCIQYTSTDSIVVGTLKGLGIYHNREWKVYDTVNSDIPFNLIYSIAVDSFGAIWLGTLKGLLLKFDGKKWEQYSLSNCPLGSKYIEEIGIDTRGRCWSGIGDQLVCFDGRKWHTYDSSMTQILDTMFTKICNEPTHTVWVDSNCAIIYYQYPIVPLEKKIGWRTYPLKNKFHGSRIKRDNEGNYWHGTINGLWKYTKTESKLFDSSNSALPFNHIKRIAIDTSNALWLSIEPKAVNSLYGMLVLFEEEDKCSTIVTCEEYHWISHIEIDNNNHIWYSMPNSFRVGKEFGKGIFCIKDGITSQYTVSNSGLSSNTVFHAFFDNKTDMLWISTYGGGISTLDKNLQWKEYTIANSHLPNNSINQIEIDSMGNKWMVDNNNFGITIHRKGGIIFQNSTKNESNNAKENNSTIQGIIHKGNFLYFSIKEPSSINVSLYSCTGKLLTKYLKKHYSSGLQKIDIGLSQLSSGYYILKVINGNKSFIDSWVLLKN